ncbi:MAG: proline--tRNA ligase [Sporolactobacillus sp.]|jgi:prolyl-tRNA synthetase|nr:proline--tRNA ligase [Sporolactobacillus sp.]MCI1882998.1 proline--tRNA ligase [Sporolactobacillus sp.]
MKQSQMFIPTLKEIPADAESASHQLLLRGGFIRQNAAGVYTYLPLGYKVVKKIETIIREEMNRTGAQELLMPALQPAELWHESGRWDVYGPELMRLKDRHGRDFALGPTGEELITSLVRDYLNSYKKLPMTVYQIQTKFRDEKRPRFGLLRGREFIMKDAYSFHDSQASLDEAYQVILAAYKRIFTRCGLKFRAVLADSGAIGGKDTFEFQALADIGEDTIAYSDGSEYAANLEMAPAIEQRKTVAGGDRPLAKQAGKVAVAATQRLGATWFRTQAETAVVYTAAGDEVNEVKVRTLLGADRVELLDGPAANPLQLKEGVRVLADQGVRCIADPAFYNEAEDMTYLHVSPVRDLHVEQFADLRFVKEGDPAPDGRGTIHFAKGIEVGHVFKLGTKYSEAMGATFLDADGKPQPLLMGCYGIGISRTLSAVCEQYHDERGLIWPKALAPFTVHLITMNPKRTDQMALSEKLYRQLGDTGFDVLWDERQERPGVKFADSELIGCPLQVVVGKKAAAHVVEIGARSKGSRQETDADQVVDSVRRLSETLH